MTLSLSQGEIIAVLQTALAPAFLLVAVGGMLSLFAGRLARIIDRSRILQDLFGETEGYEHQCVVDELHDLQLRIKIVNSAIYLSVISAIVACVLIGLLFVMGLTGFDLSGVIAGAFILAMSLLSIALIQFLREVRIGVRDFMIREEYLEKTEERVKRRAS
ncbi:DUF2721 domain-containing protein [Sphingorhabdus sp. Alg231-15]|uniref:DUF2721 domain-containing protein n=1 Tax=Sphingorhabdus sp. Alg231-15 TaxID=1922222 RepID=UPI000D557AD8